MSTERLSNQVCPYVSNRAVVQTINAVTNDNMYKKKKKISLTNELLIGVIQFKRMVISQKQKSKIGSPVPVKGYGPTGAGRRAAEDARRALHVNVVTLRDAIDRERRHKREYAANVTGYLCALRRLDRAKSEHVHDLERFLAEEERAIGALRADVERVHGEYERRKRNFFEFFLDGGRDDFAETVRRFQSSLDANSAALARVGNADARIGAAVDGLCSEARSLADRVRRVGSAEDDCRGRSTAEIVKMVRRQLEDLDVAAASHRDFGAGPSTSTSTSSSSSTSTSLAAIVNRLEASGGGETDNDCVALWHAIKSLCANNRVLENAADELDGEMDALQTSLSEANAEYMTLSASKSKKKCNSVVLDDLCAVTEEIAARQMRNLEFSRILEVDDKQIAEELNKIAQLRTKISRKKKKKHILINETENIKSQLEMLKNKYEDLEKRKAFLTDDLIAVKRSPSKLAAQTDLQGLGQRVKHLKQLKVQYNKLTNKRDSLKLKLQKYQQVVKTPSRINQ